MLPVFDITVYLWSIRAIKVVSFRCGHFRVDTPCNCGRSPTLAPVKALLKLFWALPAAKLFFQSPKSTLGKATKTTSVNQSRGVAW